MHLYPNRHVPDLAALEPAERDAFVPLYLDLLRRVDALFGVKMPDIAGWHQAPVAAAGREVWRLHLQLFTSRRALGKLKYLAGSEAAMGAFINDIRPEEAAHILREARIRKT